MHQYIQKHDENQEVERKLRDDQFNQEKGRRESKKKKFIAIVSTVCMVYTLGAVSFVSALDKGRDKFTINAQHDHPDVIHKKDKKKVLDFPIDVKSSVGIAQV